MRPVRRVSQSDVWNHWQRVEGHGSPVLLCSSSIKRNGKAAEPGGKIAKSERRMKGGRIVPLSIEVEQEEDGRWLAEAPDLPGVLAYVQTRQEAKQDQEVGRSGVRMTNRRRTMTSAFVVQHVHSQEDGVEDVKFIGVYSSREKARAAVARLSRQPGFVDTQDGFHIDEYRVDQDQWAEGYVVAAGA